MVDRVLDETSVATLDMDDFAKETVEINISSLQSIKNMIERPSEDRVFRFLQLMIRSFRARTSLNLREDGSHHETNRVPANQSGEIELLQAD